MKLNKEKLTTSALQPHWILHLYRSLLLQPNKFSNISVIMHLQQFASKYSSASSTIQSYTRSALMFFIFRSIPSINCTRHSSFVVSLQFHSSCPALASLPMLLFLPIENTSHTCHALTQITWIHLNASWCTITETFMIYTLWTMPHQVLNNWDSLRQRSNQFYLPQPSPSPTPFMLTLGCIGGS